MKLLLVLLYLLMIATTKHAVNSFGVTKRFCYGLNKLSRRFASTEIDDLNQFFAGNDKPSSAAVSSSSSHSQRFTPSNSFSNQDKKPKRFDSKPQRYRDSPAQFDREDKPRRFDRDREQRYNNDSPRFSHNDYKPKRFEDRSHGDRFRDEKPKRTFRNRNSYDSPRSYEVEEKHVPVYGHYDGDHLYGVAPVRLALLANRRQFDELIVQQDMNLEDKKDSKAALEILELCELKNIPINKYSKHDLNMLAENRPHQGFILRSQPLNFLPLKALEPSPSYRVVLALDEVNDPQNFGALLRTSYFLGIDKVVVCAKNSAPLSPVVSKASAGALEVMTVYSTDNLMRFLDASKENGWQVMGTHLTAQSVPLLTVKPVKPTVLVLGNEGYGLRTNIARRCDVLVKIPQLFSATLAPRPTHTDVSAGMSGMDAADGVGAGEDVGNGIGMDGMDVGNAVDNGSGSSESSVHSVEMSGGEGIDSLNVSVTGGIILHHLLAVAPATTTTNTETNEQVN